MPPPTPLAARLAAVLCLALVIGSCREAAAPEVDPLGGASLRRLPLWPLAGSPQPEEIERVERILVPADTSSWTIRAASSEVVEVEGRSHLRLDGDADQAVSIPIDRSSRDFNQVAVTLRTGIKRELAVYLGVSGQPRAVGVHPRHLDGTGEQGTWIFDFDDNLRTRRDYDLVTIEMRGWKGPWELHGVDLLQRPRAAWLPPHDARAPVAIGADGRQAVGLTVERALQSEFEVPPRATLDFAVGVPRTLVLPNKKEPLRVGFRLFDGDELLESSDIELVPAEEGWIPWVSTVVDLSNFAGRKLRATFALEGRVGSVCALSVPHVFGRGDEEPQVVLLVTSDTHRADHVGAAGGDVKTPALDALAAAGVLFTDCLTSTNVTNPSHIALMTATHPRDTGILDNYRQVSSGAPTLAEQFRDRGFTTLATVSAQHLSHAESGLGQGFDRISAPRVPQRDSVETIGDLIQWLPELDDRPLFVWLHVFDAHTPYEPPAPYGEMYRPEGSGNPFAPGQPELEGFADAFLQAAVGRPGLRDLEFPNTQYRGEVSYLDERLSTVLGHARFQNAIVAVTSDHGESLGEHGVYWDHAGLYPQTLRVPLILRWPGVPAGVRSEAPVRQIDVGRTLLNLASLDRMEFAGRDLREALPDEATGAIDEAAGKRPRFALAAHGLSASITEGKWHLVLHLRRHFPQSNRLSDVKVLVPEHSVELYDLENDPHCENDLRKRVKIAKPLRAKLLAWLRARQELGWKGEALQDAGRMAELAELGYASPEGGDESELFDFDCDCDNCAIYR